MAPLFEHHGTEVWVPELGGVIDPRIAGQEELMILLGIVSKREVARVWIKVRAAMTMQTRDQGRHLGDRPPYGYRPVDADPRPNAPAPGREPEGVPVSPARETGCVGQWCVRDRVALWAHTLAQQTWPAVG